MPAAKPERVVLPLKTVDALAEAVEKISDKFDASPELKDLYYDGFNQMLDTIERNVKTPIGEKKFEITINNT